MIAFACFRCGSEYKVGPERIGRPSPCRSCGATLTVPTASEDLGSIGGFTLAPLPEPEPVTFVPPAPPPPPKARRASAPPPEPESDSTYGLDNDRPRRRPRPRPQPVDDERDYEPRRRRAPNSSGGSSGKVIGILVTGMVLLGIGARVAKVFLAADRIESKSHAAPPPPAWVSQPQPQATPPEQRVGRSQPQALQPRPKPESRVKPGGFEQIE